MMDHHLEKVGHGHRPETDIPNPNSHPPVLHLHRGAKSPKREEADQSPDHPQWKKEAKVSTPQIISVTVCTISSQPSLIHILELFCLVERAFTIRCGAEAHT